MPVKMSCNEMTAGFRHWKIEAKSRKIKRLSK